MPAPAGWGDTAPVTLGDLKKQLNRALDDTSDDDEMTLHLNAAIEAVEGKVGPLTVQTFTEQHRPPGRWVSLDRRPLVSVTSVTTADGGVLQLADDALDEDAATVQLPVAGGRRPHTIVYQAGRAKAPAAHKLAVLIIAQHLWNAQHGGGGRVMPGDEPIMVPGISFAIPMRAAELITDDIISGIA
ncbi:hypothetical protein ACIBBG_32010 [Micromonospora chersina]|uniref:hypothetical protein n=1 Tax=Micromonospora chersina TaxID=47854 RepID=UPI0037B7E99D